MSSVHVAVRVRPFSKRELAKHAAEQGGLEVRPVLKIQGKRVITDKKAQKDGKEKVWEQLYMYFGQLILLNI